MTVTRKYEYFLNAKQLVGISSRDRNSKQQRRNSCFDLDVTAENTALINTIQGRKDNLTIQTE
jgi:hypothetical protein